LEDDISGPLYKTIYCTNKRFYSVSRINEFLAWVVIGVWIILFLQYIFLKLKVFGCNNIIAIIAFVLTGISIFCLSISCRSSGSGYKRDLPQGVQGEFIDRKEQE
jgi:hypothetical protein